MLSPYCGYGQMFQIVRRRGEMVDIVRKSVNYKICSPQTVVLIPWYSPNMGCQLTSRETYVSDSSCLSRPPILKADHSSVSKVNISCIFCPVQNQLSTNRFDVNFTLMVRTIAITQSGLLCELVILCSYLDRAFYCSHL